MPADGSQERLAAAIVAIGRARREARQPAIAMCVQPEDADQWLLHAVGRPAHPEALAFAAARNAAQAILVAEANPLRLNLHSPLSAVPLRDAGALRPINRVDPRVQPLLQREHLWTHVQQQAIQKLVTALAEAESQAPDPFRGARWCDCWGVGGAPCPTCPCCRRHRCAALRHCLRARVACAGWMTDG